MGEMQSTKKKMPRAGKAISYLKGVGVCGGKQ